MRRSVTEKDRLKATVDWAGPAHAYFQPEWRKKALGTREYLFDLFGPCLGLWRAKHRRIPCVWSAHVTADTRLIGKPSARMLLINGEGDTQVPIDDVFVLLRSGTPKEASVNPTGRPCWARSGVAGRQISGRRCNAVGGAGPEGRLTVDASCRFCRDISDAIHE